MSFVYNDGGRLLAGYSGSTGDCVTRAIAIASGRPYSEVYDALAAGNAAERRTKRATKASGKKTAARGIDVRRKWFRDQMAAWGFTWTPTMGIGTGCRVHLVAGELPAGRLVVAVSKHYTAVIDGVIHDTYDPTDRPATIYPLSNREAPPKGSVLLENGNGWLYAPDRCVYGYWTLQGVA